MDVNACQMPRPHQSFHTNIAQRYFIHQLPLVQVLGACEQTVSSETRDVDMGGFTTCGWPDVRRNDQLWLGSSWLETTVRTEGVPTH